MTLNWGPEVSESWKLEADQLPRARASPRVAESDGRGVKQRHPGLSHSFAVH